MKTNLTRRHGGAMLTAMVVIIILSLVTATFVAVAKQRAYMARKLADRAKSIAIAEAGLNEAYSRLATNFALRNDPSAFPVTAYGGGSYDVTISNVDSKTVVLISTGKCNTSSAAVVADVRDYGNGTGGNVWGDWDRTALDYAMVCGGLFDFGGCGDVSATNGNAKVHSNDKITMRGNAESGAGVNVSSSEEISVSGSAHITGDATAPVLSLGPSDVDGTITEQAVPRVTIPQIDMTPYYNWARDHGEVKTNFSPGATYTPNGGVVWVVGDVHLAGGTINGTLIVTGNIHLSAKVNINPSQYGFGLVSLNGDIQNQSGGTLKGITYVKNGNFMMTANGVLDGQLIVAGTIFKAGCSDTTINNHYVPTLPGNDIWGAVTNIPVISAWQK